MKKMKIIALDLMAREIETYEDWAERIDKDALLQALKDYVALQELMNSQATDRLTYGLAERQKFLASERDEKAGKTTSQEIHPLIKQFLKDGNETSS